MTKRFVATPEDLEAAIREAVEGDEIVLCAGADYTGRTIELRRRADGGRLTLRTATRAENIAAGWDSPSTEEREP